MRQLLKLSTIKEIENGKLERAVDRELAAVAKDIRDRPGLEKTRTVMVQLEFTPVSDGLGDTDPLAKFKFRVKSNVPSKDSAEYTLGVNGAGAFEINPDSPDDPRQGTLDEVAGG